jgi:phage-related protein
MALPLFVPPSSPTVSSQIGIRVNAKRVQFGDGYVQRQEHAVNSRKRVANWQWSLLSDADTDNAVTGFRHTFPNEATERQYMVTGDIQVSPVSGFLNEVSVQVEEIFDP